MKENPLFDTAPKAPRRRLNTLPDNPESYCSKESLQKGRFPSWLHRKFPKGQKLWETENLLEQHRLHTVCEEARCPNQLECWSQKTATFLIMGKECTRACGFCDIDTNKIPDPLDPEEPLRVANSVKQLGLKHVVITMVARDDLPDQGAKHIVAVINKVRELSPKATIEVLTSDFNDNKNAIDRVLHSHPEIFNHNIETVEDLTPKVRYRATYHRSLKLLEYLKHNSSNILVKSGIMVGLGETKQQVKATIQDLHQVGCDIITIGQYLQASAKKLRVKAFIPPETFLYYEEYGRSLGIPHMICGPFVRSSYHAAKVLTPSND